MEGIRQDTRLVVAQLEGQVARLRAMVWILFLCLAAAAGAFAWRRLHPKAAPSAAVREFVVEDAGGAGRVLITGHGISLLDGQGQPQAVLALDGKGGAQLQLKNAEGAQAALAPAGLTLADAKKDAAVMTTANGATIQLRRADKVVFKQPWDAQELK